MTTICEVPTLSKLIPCPRVKSWPSAHSPSHHILKAGVWFSEGVTRLLGLLGPIKPDMWPVHNSRLAIGAKMTQSLTDTDDGYHIETLLALPGLATIDEHNLYLS
jgi:hypothetical protein